MFSIGFPDEERFVEVEVTVAADGTATYDGLTLAELDASLPNQYVPQKLAAGKEVLIGYASPMMTDALSVIQTEGFTEDMKQLGITCLTTDANSDPMLQLTQIENFLQMGVALIRTQPYNTDTYNGYTEKCEELGTYFVIGGVEVDYYLSGSISNDTVTIGEVTISMATAWLDEQYPDAGAGEINTIVYCNTRTDDNAKRTAMLKAAGSVDDRINVVFEAEDCMTLETAFGRTEEAFTYDPSIKLALCFATVQATGANNYIVTMPGLDYDSVGVFCAGVDPAVNQLIDEAGNGMDTSVIRGCICFGFENLWDSTTIAATRLLLQGYETPVRLLEPIYTYTYLDFYFEAYRDM